VTGNVADDEDVENAVTIAGPIALKWRSGLTFPRNFKRRGRMTTENKLKLIKAVTKNRARLLSELKPNVANVSATRQNTPRGRHFKTRWVT
jgi:hypothetical protein